MPRAKRIITPEMAQMFEAGADDKEFAAAFNMKDRTVWNYRRQWKLETARERPAEPVRRYSAKRGCFEYVYPEAEPDPEPEPEPPVAVAEAPVEADPGAEVVSEVAAEDSAPVMTAEKSKKGSRPKVEALGDSKVPGDYLDKLAAIVDGVYKFQPGEYPTTMLRDAREYAMAVKTMPPKGVSVEACAWAIQTFIRMTLEEMDWSEGQLDRYYAVVGRFNDLLEYENFMPESA